MRSPVGEIRITQRVAGRPRGEIRGKVIGILNDDFGNYYSQRLRELLVERYAPAEVLYWHKPNNSSGAPQPLIDEVAAHVDVAIVGIAA